MPGSQSQLLFDLKLNEVCNWEPGTLLLTKGLESITGVILLFTSVIDSRHDVFMDANKQLPKISEAEWEVMEALWMSSPLSAHQIIETLDHKEWNPKTVKTLLFRLEKKGAISHEAERREYMYFPLVEKAEYVKTEGQSFIKKLFNGATAPMMAHFIKNQKMTKEELQEIRKLIDQLEEQS